MSVTSRTRTELIAEVEVTSVERLSPSFVRVELGSPELAGFGVDGPLYDQRVKLIFPGSSGRVPAYEVGDEDENWYAAWLAQPADERGHMRTYTIRDVRGSGVDTRLVFDLVLHPEHAGPGSAWAGRARVGDRIVVVVPRRGVPYGGIEFDPGESTEVLLVGDETAVPAVCAILETLPRGFRGRALLEVPHVGDVLPVDIGSDVVLEWLPREGLAVGERLVPAVLAHLGVGAGRPAEDGEVDPDLWETPTYSSSGEAVEDEPAVGHDLAGLYAWIAGESKMVTTLRRALVGEVGLNRRQVAFMGYWRIGVAMKS